MTALCKGNSRLEIDEFADWFGSSKTVDIDGVPLLLHHGTHGDFATFDMKMARDGAHFFTPDETHAASFGPPKSYYVKLENPMEISQDDLDSAWDKEHPDGDQDHRTLLPRDFVGDFVRLAKSLGHDGLVIRQMGDRDIQSDMYLPFASDQIVAASRVLGIEDFIALNSTCRP